MSEPSGQSASFSRTPSSASCMCVSSNHFSISLFSSCSCLPLVDLTSRESLGFLHRLVHWPHHSVGFFLSPHVPHLICLTPESHSSARGTWLVYNLLPPSGSFSSLLRPHFATAILKQGLTSHLAFDAPEMINRR